MTIQDRASARPGGLALSAVSRLAVVGWLTAFILFEWARLKLDTIGGGWESLYQHVSALECLEIVLIARLIDPRARSPQVGAGEATAILAGAAFLTLVATSRPAFSVGILSLFVLIRFGRDPAYRIFAAALFAFAAQYLLLSGPFMWLHDASALGDAWITRHVMNLAGFGVVGAGTFIMRPAADFGVNVIWGCTTSYAAASVAAGFVILVLARRRDWRRADFGWLAGLLLATFLVNLVRLVVTSISREDHQFWHDGAGTAVFAVGYLALVYAFAVLATRQQRVRPPA